MKWQVNRTVETVTRRNKQDPRSNGDRNEWTASAIVNHFTWEIHWVRTVTARVALDVILKRVPYRNN